MYNLLIVDDEPLILDGLFNNIHWEESGFSSVYKAEDPREALEIVRRFRIDVVVTDISMPGMDGLEMCGRIREAWPLCRIILLSGYREFDYAQRAVELGAYQYLVKPVRYEDLQSIVEGALSELRAELEQRQLLEHARRRLEEQGAFMRERFLSGWLMMGSVDPAANAREMWDVGLQIRPDMHGFAILAEWQRAKGTPVVQLGVQELAEKLLSGSAQTHFLPVSGNGLLIVFLSDSREDATAFRSLCHNRLDVFQHSAESGLDILMSFYVGSVRAAADLRGVCASLKTAARRMRAEPGAILLLDDGEEDELPDSASLRDAIARLDERDLNAWIDRCEELPRRLDRKDRLEQWAGTAVFAAISGDAIQRGFVFEELRPFCAPLLSPGGQTLAVCREAAQRYLAFVRKGRGDQRGKLAASVRALIEERMAEGITVSAIAEAVHYNPNYLSQLIRQETGLSLEEMLISMRVEKACQLLRSGMRVQEVALQVGYDNLAHFSRLFKRRMGVSPRQYAE